MFTETWLTESDHAPYLKAVNVKALQERKSEEVALRFKENISYHVVKEISFINSYVKCLVLCIGKPVNVVIYRSPTGDRGDFFKFFGKLVYRL